MGSFVNFNTDFACGLAQKGLASGFEHPRKYSHRSLSQLAESGVPFRSTYLMLKNGLIMRNGEGREAAEILCNIDQAKGLRKLAGQIWPDAAHTSKNASDSRPTRFAASVLTGKMRVFFASPGSYLKIGVSQCS